MPALCEWNYFSFELWLIWQKIPKAKCLQYMTPWGKNFKRRSLIKLKMSATVIYRFLNWIAPCKVLLVSTVLLESFPVTLKKTTQGKFESMSIKITWFFHISYHHISSCSLQSRLCTFQSFFFNFYFKKFCFQLPKNVPWNEAHEKLLVEA